MLSQFVIAVLRGTGNEGGGLALRLANAGHRVIVGSREKQKAVAAALELNAQLGMDLITGQENLEAAAAANIIILAVPYAAQKNTVSSVSNVLEGKLLIDATVPLMPPKVGRVQLSGFGSAVAELQHALGEKVKIVSAFQNVSAHHLKDLEQAVDCDAWYAAMIRRVATLLSACVPI